MSKIKECKSCEYFQSITDPNNIGRPQTRCGRFPPTGQAIQMQGQTAVLSVWPPAQPDDVCGEYKAIIEPPLQ